MPLSSALVVLAITLAFIIFAVVLAWGDYQASHASRTDRQSIDKGRKITG